MLLLSVCQGRPHYLPPQYIITGLMVLFRPPRTPGLIIRGRHTLEGSPELVSIVDCLRFGGRMDAAGRAATLQPTNHMHPDLGVQRK